MKNVLLASLVLALSVAAPAAAQDAQTPQAICDAAATDEPATREYTQAEQVLEPGVDYRAILCTGAGPIYVDLFEGVAPVTVNNFVFLAENGYYNNTNFHRVIQDFMVQGGDPTNTGTGGPGYQFQDEFAGFLTFDRPGLLAMANANRPEQGIVGTNGSQFFITTVPTPHLDFRHTIFGEVLEGQENVEGIEIRDPQTATDPGTALNTVVIITDPTTVETTFVEGEPTTREDVEAGFAAFGDTVPETMTYETTSLSSDEAAEASPALADWFGAHNHEYRVSGTVDNCELTAFPAMTLSYTLDRFATPEDAAAALSDPLLADATTGMDLAAGESEFLANPIYSAPTTACDTDATRAITHWQHGHFVVTAEVVAPADGQITADLWLAEVVGTRMFEPLLTDVLRGELR